jgi:hypothetical protein
MLDNKRESEVIQPNQRATAVAVTQMAATTLTFTYSIP